MEERYWPFSKLKPEEERTEFDRDYIDFMRSAYAEGFRPREVQCMAVDAESPTRFITLIRRGFRNGWEPRLLDAGKFIPLGPLYNLRYGVNACLCVRPPFRAVAHFALEWLRGRELQSILGEYDFVGGRPSGIAWIALRTPTQAGDRTPVRR